MNNVLKFKRDSAEKLLESIYNKRENVKDIIVIYNLKDNDEVTVSWSTMQLSQLAFMLAVLQQEYFEVLAGRS